jgi:hypothetical protein
MTLRAYRLATAAAIGSTLSLALAGPAAAASGNIGYFNGEGRGSAIQVAVSPSAILNVNLSGVQQILNQLPLGAGATIDNLAGSTLANPTSDINIALDQADAKGTANDGVHLSDGTADSVPLAIKIDSLANELQLLNAALQDIPKGTLDAVQAALQPLLANAPSLQSALTLLNTTLGAPIADTLGDPSVHLTQLVHANFGEDKTGDVVTINQGLLTHLDPYHLDLYHAKAITSQAMADNHLTSLDVAPSLLGSLSIPTSNASLVNALGTVQQALQQIENQLSSTASAVPVAGPVAVGVLGTVTSTVNNTTHAVVNTTSGTLDLSKVDQVIQQMTNLRAALANLNGLEMNDIVRSGQATAFGNLQRVGDQAKADGTSQAVNLQAVNLDDPALANLLNTLFASSPVKVDFLNQPLVQVQGISAGAHVALDGAHAPSQNASDPAYAFAEGNLAEIDVLGMPIINKTTLDSVLPPGTSCVLNIPGKSTCALLPTAIQDLLNVNLPVIGNTPILSLTLSRGAQVLPSTNGISQAAASIVTLEAKLDLNLSALSSIAQSATGTLAALTLPVAVTPGAAFNPTGANILDAEFGVASAFVSTNPAQTYINNPPGSNPPGVRPPSTGNDVLPLAILALALMGAGAGLTVRQARAVRN